MKQHSPPLPARLLTLGSPVLAITLVVAPLPVRLGVLLAQNIPTMSYPCPISQSDTVGLILVTATNMNTPIASVQLFQRETEHAPWHAVNASEPAVLGHSGMAWGADFHGIALRGEPLKTEGDMRSPGGIYRVGRSFGFAASSRPAYLQLLPRKTVCVDDSSSPAYNTITTRAAIGSNVHTEDMSGNLYRRGLVIDYPTDAAAKSGSCIFIHVWRAAERGTSGCVGLPEPRVASLQDFSERPTAVAILPHGAMGRFADCLPEIARGTVSGD